MEEPEALRAGHVCDDDIHLPMASARTPMNSPNVSVAYVIRANGIALPIARVGVVRVKGSTQHPPDEADLGLRHRHDEGSRTVGAAVGDEVEP